MAYQNRERLGADNQALEYSVGPPTLAYVMAYEYGIGPPAQSRQSENDLVDCRLCASGTRGHRAARLAHRCQHSRQHWTKCLAVVCLDILDAWPHGRRTALPVVWLDVWLPMPYGLTCGSVCRMVPGLPACLDGISDTGIRAQCERAPTRAQAHRLIFFPRARTGSQNIAKFWRTRPSISHL